MLRVAPVPAFRDNYIWVIHDAVSAVAVDPGDARPVLDFLSAQNLQLTAILNTHHHADHVGGNAGLLRRFPVPVYGPRNESIAQLTHRLAEGDRVHLTQLALTLEVLDIPGHTAGHIAFHGGGYLFCGDTLFACGCGRLFEGTAEQMLHSLGKLARLAAETEVYCGHEYTQANIRFARCVEPGNQALREREIREAKKRASDLPTLPTTLGLERETNPFLRCDQAAVSRAVAEEAGIALDGEVGVFAALREWKNNFQG
jgi:hydroxyacylglutathione hydrolase